LAVKLAVMTVVKLVERMVAYWVQY